MLTVVAGFAPFCQLAHVFWLIAGFLYVLMAAIVVALGFLIDLVTWFSLGLYEFYLHVFMNAWHFLASALNFQCG